MGIQEWIVAAESTQTAALKEARLAFLVSVDTDVFAFRIDAESIAEIIVEQQVNVVTFDPCGQDANVTQDRTLAALREARTNRGERLCWAIGEQVTIGREAQEALSWAGRWIDRAGRAAIADRGIADTAAERVIKDPVGPEGLTCGVIDQLKLAAAAECARDVVTIPEVQWVGLSIFGRNCDVAAPMSLLCRIALLSARAKGAALILVLAIRWKLRSIFARKKKAGDED